jgi:flavin-dependent dehydrogenase
MLKTYSPETSVAIFEREIFPREHVGESLLPVIGLILQEIGAWDDVEAANFPIKVGATYKWGTTDDLWNFNLLDTREIVDDSPRPGKFEGWRMRSTWQVERGEFDKILLDRSKSLGCDVFEGVAVSTVERSGDFITGIRLSDGSTVSAKYYVDASGIAGVLRKAMGVEVDEPASLKNIAIWDYWEDAEWAVTIGKGATRVQVASIGYGWLWFIPVTPSRTSIGLVCPAEYYKRSGKRPEELYAEAVQADPRISSLLSNATAQGNVRATKDWSFVAQRMAGENWFLAGESAGFADPILASGLTISMTGAKECAYSILELERGTLGASWLKASYENRQTQRISQHIRFANFWYTSNRHFTDLMEFTTEIARDAGFEMDAQSAWQWLGTGGFISLETSGSGLAGHSFEQLKGIEKMMFNEESEWLVTKSNLFDLDIEGAEVDTFPVYRSGEIAQTALFRKDGKELPNYGGFKNVISALKQGRTLPFFIQELRKVQAQSGPIIALNMLEALESMLKDGWVKGTVSPELPLLRTEDIPRTAAVDWNRDASDPKARLAYSN